MDKMTAVIIPTYNEKDNIVKMIDEINALNLPIDILVVDDNSPDGTGSLVESAKASRPNLDIIHRKKKEGIGPAYTEGLRDILDKDSHDYIIQMDADFSHDPKDIPRLMEAAPRYDVVIGSRYTSGGGVAKEWSMLRKFLSKGGNLYARMITGLKAKDCTGGFRCYKKDTLRSINLGRIFLNGYGFQIQLLYELAKKKLSVGEVPIFFAERTRGTSKMNFSIILEAFLFLIILRLKDVFNKL